MASELADLVAGLDPVAICCRSPVAFDIAHRWAIARGRPSLLVPSGDWARVAAMRAELPALLVLTDTPADDRLAPFSPVATASLEVEDELPPVDAWPDPLAIVFTSGSTGDAKPHPKRPHALVGELERVRRALGDSIADAFFVGTLPLEHTFGYSFAYWLPRLHGAAVRLERVSTPNQLRQLDRTSGRPLWIVTTPTHMKLCTELDLHLSRVAGVVCATSPLGTTLARRGAAAYGVAITECYGSTETGTIAFRSRSADEHEAPPWELLVDATLNATPDGQAHAFAVPHLPAPVVLGDRLAVDGPRFQLLGRVDDVIKVCGKRHSLSALNQRLAEVPGVADAHYFLPDAADEDDTVRPSALVRLAQGVTPWQVLAALRGTVDDLFLPRPLVVLDRLPRTESGKLRREDVLAAWRAHQQAQAPAPASIAGKEAVPA